MKNTIILMLGLALLGAYLVYYSLTASCPVEKMTQTVQGQTVEVDAGTQYGKLICIATNPKLMLFSLVGSLLFFSCGGRFIKEVNL